MSRASPTRPQTGMDRHVMGCQATGMPAATGQLYSKRRIYEIRDYCAYGNHAAGISGCIQRRRPRRRFGSGHRFQRWVNLDIRFDGYLHLVLPGPWGSQPGVLVRDGLVRCPGRRQGSFLPNLGVRLQRRSATPTGGANPNLYLFLAPAGEATIYFNPNPGSRDFTNLLDRSTWGEPVAVFTREASLVRSSDGLLTDTFIFSAKLVSSETVSLNGKHFNFRDLIPHGMTCFETGYEGSSWEAGSCIAIGGGLLGR